MCKLSPARYRRHFHSLSSAINFIISSLAFYPFKTVKNEKKNIMSFSYVVPFGQSLQCEIQSHDCPNGTQYFQDKTLVITVRKGLERYYVIS